VTPPFYACVFLQKLKILKRYLVIGKENNELKSDGIGMFHPFDISPLWHFTHSLDVSLTKKVDNSKDRDNVVFAVVQNFFSSKTSRLGAKRPEFNQTIIPQTQIQRCSACHNLSCEVLYYGVLRNLRANHEPTFQLLLNATEQFLLLLRRKPLSTYTQNLVHLKACTERC